jgi:hypothetical protein
MTRRDEWTPGEVTPMAFERDDWRRAKGCGNGSRKRRFSADPARRRHYAGWRAARFARRFGG